MNAAKKKDDGKLTVNWLCDACMMMFTRLLDFKDYQSQRIAALEDRLAQLDGRDDAKAARHAAFAKEQSARLAAGHKPLVFNLVESDGGCRIEWTEGMDK